MELEKIMEERYSVRTFSEKKIEADQVEELLQVIEKAPTACNLQPIKVYVLETEEALEKIGTLARTYQAPLVLLIASDQEEVWKNPKEEGYDTGEMDGSIACTYLMLKATELGIGSVWIRYFNSKEVKQAYSLPESITPVCLLALGYPADNSEPSLSHFQKKPLEDKITYL